MWRGWREVYPYLPANNIWGGVEAGINCVDLRQIFLGEFVGYLSGLACQRHRWDSSKSRN